MRQLLQYGRLCLPHQLNAQLLPLVQADMPHRLRRAYVQLDHALGLRGPVQGEVGAALPDLFNGFVERVPVIVIAQDSVRGKRRSTSRGRIGQRSPPRTAPACTW